MLRHAQQYIYYNSTTVGYDFDDSAKVHFLMLNEKDYGEKCSLQAVFC